MVYCYWDDSANADDTNNNDDSNYVCDSYWSDSGRWILVSVVVGAFVLFVVSYFLFACMTSRRRARQGMKPYYGTAWAAPPAYSRDDPHPQVKDLELNESPAPSYQAATEGRSEEANVDASAAAGVRGEEYVQDGMNTTTSAQGDHGLAVPGRVADPDVRRDHGAV